MADVFYFPFTLTFVFSLIAVISCCYQECAKRPRFYVADQEIVYQIAVEEIRSIKQQQWNVAYFAVLIYGGLIAISNTTKKTIVLLLIIVAIAFLVSAVQPFLILKLQSGIQQNRREQLSTRLGRDSLRRSGECHTQYLKSCRDRLFILLFLGSNIVGALLSFIIILDP